MLVSRETIFSKAEKEYSKAPLVRRKNRELLITNNLILDDLNSLMEHMDISYYELAKRVGWNHNFTERLLSGELSLSIEEISEICFALGVRFVPRLEPIIRSGTKAGDDPEYPHWVCQFEYIEDVWVEKAKND